MELLITLLISVGLAAVSILALVSWSRKQQHIDEMVFLCMKYLVHTQDHQQRVEAARALAGSNDREAVLVLLDVVLDEEEPDSVQDAARQALQDMYRRFRKHRRIVRRLTRAAEQGNLQRVLDILITRFERRGHKSAQSAYLIGRLYMRLGRFDQAREWLAAAESRNRKINLYGERIKDLIHHCDLQLLTIADQAYRKGDYQLAKEHYAVLDAHLESGERRRLAIYLRTACVYCKLKDYSAADQALLQALEHQHEMDLSLNLVSLLQRNQTTPAGDEDRLQSRVDEIMHDLLNRNYHSKRKPATDSSGTEIPVSP